MITTMLLKKKLINDQRKSREFSAEKSQLKPNLNQSIAQENQEVMKMKHLTTRWYYTLAELTHEAIPAWEVNYADGAPTVGMAAWLRELGTHYDVVSVNNPWNTYDTTENKKMWADYL